MTETARDALALQLENCDSELEGLWVRCKKEQFQAKVAEIASEKVRLVALRYQIENELNRLDGVTDTFNFVPFCVAKIESFIDILQSRNGKTI